ncbi:MAG: hypothetical protein K2M42_00945 [Oscillospiraceae bacterium]|nr:hypothetical protein [Oscillospiraceae bacterium]
MTQFTLTRELMGAPVTAHAICLPSGLQVTVYGGTLPHIGAVSVVDPQGNVTTQQFPTHKDGVVSQRWAQAISEAGYCPVVIAAGIHYDGLSREQIGDVVKLTDDMLVKLLHTLKAGKIPLPDQSSR